MDSILTVVTPAPTQDLTVLATVKAELSITDNAHDARLAALIEQASGDCADYCGRVFGQETVSEQFRLGHIGMGAGFRTGRNPYHSPLKLSRYPVVSITSVTENDAVLTIGTDYEIDSAKGFLHRLSSGQLGWGWPNGKIVVVYVAGYALLDDVPDALERACIEIVKGLWFASQRDPMVRQVNIPGVIERSYFSGAAGASPAALPAEATDRLNRFREVRF